MKKRTIVVEMTFCLAGICNRSCSHCFIDGDMNGKCFSLENALLLSRDIRRISKLKQFSEYNIYFNFQLTGEGELLLNPNLLEIMDLLMGMNKNVYCSVITSGADPNSKRETNFLLKLANAPYSDRLGFFLSFNDFQKRFPERLIHSMDLLFSNGVDNIGVKVCLHNYYRRTIANLIRTIKKYYYRKFRSVLNDDEIFCSMMNGEETERILCKSYLVGVNGRSVEEVNDLARDSFVEIRNLSEKEMWTESDYFLINFRQTIQTKTDYGLKHIIFAPHFLSKKGRAEKIEKRFLVGSIRENNCSYLFDDVDERGPHLAADGYYYPYGLCPQERSMRIGHVSGSIREVLYWHNFFRSKFLQAILSDCTNRNVCEVCLGTSVKY